MPESTITVYSQICYEVRNRVAEITLNRPDRKNAFTVTLLDELFDALVAAEADTAVRAVIVTGAGTAFSVGADLHGPDTLTQALHEDLRGHTAEGYREPAGRISEFIHRMSIPVIGAINGHAVGGGATILAAMHVRIAVESAKFGFVFTRRGVCPEGASSWFLPRLVGLTRATDWLISGRVFDAQEALAAGFLTRMVPDGSALDEARRYSSQFASITSPASVAHTLSLLSKSWVNRAPADAARTESAIYARLVDTSDAREGVLSFLEHREPTFTSTGRVS